MRSPSRSRAFTLIELLVVVAIIALLISILLPSLKEAREQGKKGVCLANLRSISQASNAYSSEDRREHAIPIHMATISPMHAQGFSGEWSWRTACPFNFGGRTPEKPFPGQGNVMTDPDGVWSSKHRPLNLHIYGKLAGLDEGEFNLFRCPSDQGFPETPYIQDAPPPAAGVPCYDYLGNSYRISVAGYLFPSGSLARGYQSIAPWGHRLSTLVDTGKLVAYCEPLFYWFSRQQPNGFNPDVLRNRGWHGKRMTDNVAFADGSARPTLVEKSPPWDQNTKQQMNLTTSVPDYYVLRRGNTWRMDCYPTPGAWIRVRNGSGGWLMPEDPYKGTGWPLNGYQNNIVEPRY